MLKALRRDELGGGKAPAVHDLWVDVGASSAKEVTALVSLPLRCMHSVVETAHLDDIESTIRLLEAFVLSLKESDTFHQSLGA